MSLENIQKQIERDIVLDSKNLSKNIIQIPSLHSKYLILLQKEQLRAAKLQDEYDAMYRERYMYYRNDHNIIFKNKAEIDIMINGDESIKPIKNKLFLSRNICELYEGAIKQIGGMSFLIRDFIEWEKFQGGA
jgi:hypothetical protein